MRCLWLALLPSLVWAQAEPAPEGYRPPRQPGMPQPQEAAKRQADSKLPKWHISVAPHLDFPLQAPVLGLPLVGYGAGVSFSRALVPVGLGRFGVGADFAYDRFSHDVTPNMFPTGTQFVAHATFAAMAIFDGIAGRFRGWLGLGGGLSVANYESPVNMSMPMGESRVGVAGLVKLALGFGIRVYDGFDIGLRGDFNITISDENINGVRIWQPGLFALGLDLGYRF